MRKVRIFLLLLSILIGIQGLVLAQSSGEKRLSITRDVMDEFGRGTLASIRERFNADTVKPPF